MIYPCAIYFFRAVIVTVVLIVIIIRRFYIALFSALEQSYCALVRCDSDWVTVLFYSAYFWYPPKWCTDSAVLLLHGWCSMKLLRSWRKIRVHHWIMHQFTVTPFKATWKMYGACVFSFNLPPARLAEWPGSFTCYCGNTGEERILK